MKKYLFFVFLFLLFISAFTEESFQEFQVKREEVFEFVQKPQISKDGNNFNISFESKAFCDVTIAIENAEGKIVRHLVSGVLGPKAPAPLLKNSKVQKVIWDGKDDQEAYLKEIDRENSVIRVSLGLNPQFERTMFWSPNKRLGHQNPPMCATPEGVYVGETSGVEQVRLFDHQGNYVRTIYPFPSDKMDKVKDLKMHQYVQDGKTKPVKRSYLQSTILTVTDDSYYHGGEEPVGIVAIASAKGNVAVSGLHLNRLGVDGTSNGFSFYGPQIALPVKDGKDWGLRYSPRSMVFSPDGKWLYFTGYSAYYRSNKRCGWLNAVTRMPYDGSQPPTLWAGDLTEGVSSKEEGKFRMPTSIAMDSSGRVYVSDYMNDRIQIFDLEGKLLKVIPTSKPTQVSVHQKTGDIYVFSYLILELGWDRDQQPDMAATMLHLGSFDNPIVKSKCPLPLTGYFSKAIFNFDANFQHVIELDSWADKPTIWISNGKNGAITPNHAHTYFDMQMNATGGGAQLFEEIEGKLVMKTSFYEKTKKQVERIKPPILCRQRLVVNPASGKLYVLEGDSGAMKSVNQLVELSPDSGILRLVDLPLGAEDICFDNNGLIYIRTDTLIARFDMNTWKEIPFDYGIEIEKHSYGMNAKVASMVSAIQTPGHRSFNFWHLGGLDINLKGHIAVTTCNGYDMQSIPQIMPGEAQIKMEGVPYKPNTYPGRMRWGEIHIWDKHGKVIKEDAVPGMGHLNGIGLDQDDNIYLLTSAKRIFSGKQTDPGLEVDSTGTVIKFSANKGKVYSSSDLVPVPLPKAEQPKRSIDIAGMTTGWVEGAEWFYGGIGFSKPGGCVCWNARFSKDYFNRSLAPETQNYSVAVIDSNGNLILRVGKYGNVEDGKPLIADGGPKETISIGGDEVSLFYANYVASHTDKRLFIADAGNTRILSVKLGYHAEEKINIKDIK
jgi:DNA-binding beta-propeller fold protein YncE